MKSYTNLEQSRKLAEILPIESADMRYDEYTSHIDGTPKVGYKEGITEGIPCWSLAALLGVLPKSLIYTPNPTLDGYCCKNIMHDLETYGDNPIDACYELILKLHELKFL
jgi:hypothetical protein